MSHRGPRISASPARLAALEVCQTVRVRRAFTQEIIASKIDSSSMSAEDRAFATLLSLGVTSAQGTLDEVIDSFLRDPAGLEPGVRDALRISTYEILFLEKTAHAAVDQGVELAKSVNPKTSGLANAVLRKVVKARDKFPFGDIESDDEALARFYAFPLWLTKKLIDDLGREAAMSFMKASNEPAPIFLAVNALKASEAEVENVMEKSGVDARKVSLDKLLLSTCYRIRDARALQNPNIHELFSEGKVLISDLASQMIATIALPDIAPSSFLEVGAGRGTKSILLQSGAKIRYGKQMALHALDSHEFKIKLLKGRLKEYGVHLENTYIEDARSLSKNLRTQTFDAVFVDAPCSGLGTLRRHPEIRWRLKQSDINSLALVGLKMLKEVSKQVNKGGMITYSTCTVAKEENQGVIRAFLESVEGQRFELSPIFGRTTFATSLSSGSSDAHFAVRMVRKS